MRVRAAEAATNPRGPQAEGLGVLDAEDRSTVPAPVSSLRERLTRLGAPPRPRPARSYRLPRGFEELATPFGVAAMRQDVLALSALDHDSGNVAYVDTETTGLKRGQRAWVLAAGKEWRSDRA